MATSETQTIGERINLTRKKRSLSIQELANKAGCSSEYLEWVENDEVYPPVALLLQLAKVLRVDSGTFVRTDSTTEQRREEAAKRTSHYSYQSLTPSEEDSHLMAFSITIPPKTVHDGVGYQHEGEEYVYVVAGEVEITVDEEKKILGEKESLRFNSNLDHRLSNPGEKETELLVVLYTP